MPTRPVRCVLAALACLLLVACGKVTEENFAKVKVGMTMSQIRSILGEGEKEESTGTSLSSSGLAGSSSSAASSRQTYSWKDGGKQIVIEFADDKVVNARKSGF